MSAPYITNPLTPGNNEDLLSETPLEELANTDLDAPGPTPSLATLSVPAAALSGSNDHNLLFAPNSALNSSPAPPDLLLPDIPFDSPSSSLDSPTPPASQARNNSTPLAQDDSPFVHAMLVDGNSPNAASTPTGQPPTTPQGEVAAGPTDADAEPETAPMSEFLADNGEFPNNPHNNNAGNQLVQFMRCTMPPINDAHPTAPFDYIEVKTIKEWDSFPTFKLIATPFGFEARQQLKHNSIRIRLLAAVAEITSSRRAGVSAPGPTDRIIRARRRTPRAFLIHSLTREQYISLMKQKVWVSADIAFRVLPTKPNCPDFLFTIINLSSLDTDEVAKMVRSIWQREDTIAGIHEIIHSTSPSPINQLMNLPSFIASMWVECLNIKEDGGRLTPHYNVYAPGRLFPDHKVWNRVRGLLARIPYNTLLLGAGEAKLALYHCNLCHAADHPRGLCPFPRIQGWIGPSGLPDNSN